jgi:para-nitrobenzyl esterase
LILLKHPFPMSIRARSSPLQSSTFRTVLAAALAASLSCLLPGVSHAAPASSALQVQLPPGVIEGAPLQAGDTVLRVFKGIPYAAPPVGPLRWKEPQPVAQWADVREATQFGPRCMQLDAPALKFRSTSMSEDCLYLNVWTPEYSEGAKLPVLVQFHGGGFLFGDGSEPRYDGASLAARDIVTVTVNYRLGVFGFLTLSDLALESPYGSGGNYGMLDQTAALTWVRDNIARFGGDPNRVTISGLESGASAVSLHMASPVSRGLFAQVIGGSGSSFGTNFMKRKTAVRIGDKFTSDVRAFTPAALRALPAQTLLDATGYGGKPLYPFKPIEDGYFMVDEPEAAFASGKQANVPLLIGTTSHEGKYALMLRNDPPTPANWRKALERKFAARTDEVLALYPAKSKEEVMRSGNALLGDIFVDHGVWRWMDLHRNTAQAPVYSYSHTQLHPRKRASDANEQRLREAGSQSRPYVAPNSEIEYALGNVGVDPSLDWNADDRETGRLFSGYVAQFVKTGDPNGAALPTWPAVRVDHEGLLREQIGALASTIRDPSAPRHAFLKAYFEEVGAGEGDDTKL